MTVGSTAIEAEAWSLARGGRSVVAPSSFCIPKGCIVVVLGRNGIGKTTLLRGIQGIVPPLGGKLRIFGHEPRVMRGRMGVLAQRRELAAPQLRARHVLGAAWRGARWGLPFLGTKGRLAIAQAADIAGASSLLERPFAALSGGERQRVGLAQAFLGQPDLVLLDEPLAGLDPAAREDVLQAATGAARLLGATMLIAAHEPDLVLPVCDLALILDETGAQLLPAGDVSPQMWSQLYGGA